jgi:Flp pilus assembly pilin Flp
MDTVEYGLLTATVALVVLLAAHAFGPAMQAWYQAIFMRITGT